jgi:hypothetical protein
MSDGTSTPTAALTRGGGTAAGRLPPSGSPCLRNGVLMALPLWAIIIGVVLA